LKRLLNTLTGRRAWALRALVLALALLASWGLVANAQPQSSATTSAPTTSASATPEQPKDGPDSETEAFRHSGAVRWVAGVLHLDVETTAKIFEDLNSGVLILVILYFLAKALPKAFRARKETIQAKLVDARTATQQANERLAAVESRLSRLDSEIEAIRRQAERDGAQDEIRIKQSLEDERRRIVESAEHEVDSAGIAAQRKLKQFAAELAIERAASEFRLTPEMDRLLVSDFGQKLTADLAGNLNGGGRN